MNIRKLTIILCLTLCVAITATAQQSKKLEPPKSVKLAPDLSVKDVTAQWVERGGVGTGNFYLQITPVLQKNKDDKITTEPDKPMIIFVGTLTQSVTSGPTCEIKVKEWIGEETEKSFGTCLLKVESNQTLKYGTIIADSKNLIKELNENNNVGKVEIPPKPSK